VAEVSNHLTSLAYKVEVGSLLRKSVLVLLADKASDDGSGIWASKQTMADELCCSKRAIINTLRQFQAEGLLKETGKRDNANGYTVTYTLNVNALQKLHRVKRWVENDQCTPCTGEPDTPVNDVQGTGAPDAPKPPLNLPPIETANAVSPPPAKSEKIEVTPEMLGEAWNEVAAAAGAVKFVRLAPERRRKMQGYLKRYSIEDITEAIGAVARSDFLCGKSRTEFRADITFLFSAEHMNRLLEGFYER